MDGMKLHDNTPVLKVNFSGHDWIIRTQMK